MATVFDKILNTTTGPKSYNWYKNKVSSMTTPGARSLISKGKATLRPKYGIMNLFGYDPKHKDRLPYYDTFPLILPLAASTNANSISIAALVELSTITICCLNDLILLFISFN